MKPPETLQQHITIPSVANQKKHVYSNVGARLVTNFQTVSEINKGRVAYVRIKSERPLTIEVNEILVIIFYLETFPLPPF